MRVIFFGTSPLAAHLLTRLATTHHTIAAVVTKPDRPSGRGQKIATSAVKQVWESLSPCPLLLQPETTKESQFYSLLEGLKSDLFLVAAYGEIIGKNLLALPTKGAVNLHGSLLPKYRGAAPIQRALLAGETVTGVTVIQMTPKMDGGAILAKKILPIRPEDDCGSLMKRMSEEGAEIVLDVLVEIEEGKSHPYPQDESQVTFAPKIDPSDLILPWSESRNAIINRIRAFSPEPGALTFLSVNGEKKRLKIYRATSLEGESCPCGTIRLEKRGFSICSGDGWVGIEEAQLEGKRKMSGEELSRGFIGAIAATTRCL